MSKLKSVILLAVAFSLTGCLGVKTLGRGGKDKDKLMPRLCTVPEKPEPIPFELRRKLHDELLEDYNEADVGSEDVAL